MSETIKHIKKFNIGDRVTSTNTILLDRGFRGVSGIIKSIVKDNFDSWQYLIQLDDGRELQCDDWHLEQPKLDDNQQIVLEWLKSKVTEDKVNPINAIFIFGNLWSFRRYASLEERRTVNAYDELDFRQQAQVIEVFSIWAQEQEEV